jgi:hypothetical protein
MSCDARTPDSGAANGTVSLALERNGRPIESPADTGSAEPYLAADDEGNVYLSWLGRAPSGERALFVSHGRGSRFEPGRIVASGDSLFANWADTPGLIALGDGRLVAWWLVRQGDGFAYHVRVASSSDDGRTWSPVVALHGDASLTEHGFVSAAVDGDDVRLVWLDGRAFEGAEGHGHADGGAGPEMQLRSARIGADGRVLEEQIVDARVCDCCPTAAVAVSGSVLVAYRDRSPEEIRDIALARFERGAWSEPRVPHADGWHIPGCPVNGPALDARGDLVGFAWFTGASDSARVQVALSANGGRGFGAPVRVDEGNPAGRAGVAVLADGSALVTWIESVPDTAYVLVRRVTSRGASASLPIARVSSSRRSGVPRLLATRDEMVVVWTEVGPPSRVRVERWKILFDELDAGRTARGARRGPEG